MESLSSEEENIIKDLKNLSRLEKEQNYTAVKDIRNLFRLKRRIKDIVLRNIKNLLEYEKEEQNCCKPVRVNNFWSKIILNIKVTVIEIKLSVEEYLDKIRSYLKGIINDLKQSDTWKIQMKITISFISSKDDHYEECVMHSKSDKEIMINDVTYEFTEKLFNLLKNRYQNNLKLMGVSDFVLNYVQLLYYKCLKINLNHGGSYVDSLYWMKNKKATINPINKENKCLQYTITVALNYEEKKRTTKNKKN